MDYAYTAQGLRKESDIMTLEKRIEEIKEQLLWMGDKPGVSITARYDDHYYEKHVYFTALQYDKFYERIDEYAKEHPVI